MVKVLSVLNLLMLVYQGYIFIKYTDTVPWEMTLQITVGALLVGFIFTKHREEPPEVLIDECDS